ncbi:MAG: OmpH family outer membrane protein [Acidobacteria bacterium]|nr:OmpH family outer membrane protein [Acidobacteriota bacterium]
MKRLIIAIAVSSLFSFAALAQTPTPPATRPATTSSAPPASASTTATGGTGAEGKVAYINSAAFRGGIGELRVKLEALNAEFEPKKKEVESMETDLTNLRNKLNTQGSTVSPQVRAGWGEEAALNEKLLKRKAEDYDSEYQKKLQTVGAPIYDKIGIFLKAYCEQRGIVMVMEGGAAQQAGVLIYASSTTDITNDFMSEYNKANPAPAGAAPVSGVKK